MLTEEFSCRAYHRMEFTEITDSERCVPPKRVKSAMNGNNYQAQTPSFRELYGPKRSSVPWEEQQVDVVRFWTDSGDCWGFLFHHLTGAYYSAKYQSLLIDWALGTIVVKGPKALEFYEQFSNHRATLIKADGKDILSVRMHLNAGSQAKEEIE
jgi:hypothetical protein